MGKSSQNKEQQKAPKNKKNNFTQFSFHLAFEQVNNGVNRLVVGSCQMKQKFNGKAAEPHVGAKAINIPFNEKANDNPYDARMKAIEQLFRKIKGGDKVRIYTADPFLIAIANGQGPEESANARAAFNKYAEKITITIQHTNEHGRKDHIEAAERLAKIKVGALKSPDNHSKGFHR